MKTLYLKVTKKLCQTHNIASTKTITTSQNFQRLQVKISTLMHFTLIAHYQFWA